MTRLLFWLLIAWLAYGLLRTIARRGERRSHDAGVGAPAAEAMVRCARCGLNLPQSEALQGRRGWACCAEHARD